MSQPASSATSKTGRDPSDLKSSAGDAAGPYWAAVTAVYLVALSALLVYGLIVFWPSPAGSPPFVRFLWWTLEANDEVRLLIVVVIAGALGAQVHATRSLYWYIGHRRLKRNWLPMYYLLPFSGSTLALVAYIVIRGGFFSVQASIAEVNQFSFAAVAALVGLFSPEAYTWLRDVAGKFFREAPKGADQVEPESDEGGPTSQPQPGGASGGTAPSTGPPKP